MKALSRLALALLFLPLSSCQTENSSASDESRYGGGGSPAFNEARSIMSANCTGCHVYHTKTEDELVGLGVLVKGDPENSQIYYRLTGSIGGPSGHSKNMPPTGALSSGQVEAIREWIEGAL